MAASRIHFLFRSRISWGLFKVAYTFVRTPLTFL